LKLQEHIGEILEHVRGMWRYRWWAVGSAWGLSLVGSVVVCAIPDVYNASAKVFVDTNSLLRPLMEGLTATTNTMNEVQLVSRAVLTRPNLEDVAHKTDLALRARTPRQMEQLVTRLQEQILVTGGRDNIFTIQYEDVSREKARDVVAAVLDAFVEDAIGNEGTDAEVTEGALANEIEVHERRLREAEGALARFKQENLGYMPGEYGDYYNRLQAAVGLVAEMEEKSRQLAERRDELQRQLVGEEPVFGIMPGAATGSGCAQSGQIAGLQAELSQLLVNFTNKHPRVVTLQETIAHLERECGAESQALSSTPIASFDGAQPLELNPVYQNLRIQLSTAEVELAELRAALSAQQSTVARLRRDVDKITQVEAELKQLNRDYNVVQGRHQELLKRWEDLQAKKRLDPVTDNVRYRRIEPPFAQADPVGPNRPLLLILVVAAAVAGGTAVAFGLNQVNPVFFTNAGIRGAVALPVLGSISLILSPEERRRRRMATIAWAATVTLLLFSTAVSIVFARQAAAFVRVLLPGAAG
jgi:polysaccharide chain length determinant protein (PEP-CTERM system associated)